MKKNYRAQQLYEFLSGNQGVIIFITFVLISGVTSINCFSKNIWQRLDVLTGKDINNVMLFLVTFVLSFYYLKSFSNNTNYIIRTNNKNYIKNNTLNMLYIFTYTYLLYIIIIFSMCFIFSHGNYSTYMNEYGLNIIFYLTFKLLRNFFIYLISNQCIYKLFYLFDKYNYIVFIVNILPFFMINCSKTIVHFYEMPLLYQMFLLNVNFNSFFLNVLCSIITILFLLIINKFLNYLIFNGRNIYETRI